MFSKLILALFALSLSLNVSAQSENGDAILFIWNDTLSAQRIATNERITAPGPITIPANRYRNVFYYPFEEALIDGYGFYQGVWSQDETRFDFLAIQAEGAGYHVISLENEQQRVLFSGEVSSERGYLVPVGWAGDGTLILLERHMLHNLEGIKLWQYTYGVVSERYVIDTPPLKGNSASLESGWVFVGFDTVGAVGYLVNINTGQLTRFPTSFVLQDPPASVFELYPVEVVGVVNLDTFQEWEIQASDTSRVNTTPFLHWSLPDYARSITCYTDSAWTDAQFDVECPGLTTPRAYIGHEGTDIGGKPNGLEIGTPVYTAAPGLVVKRYIDCPSGDITCGDAYGNYVLLEHSRVVGYDVETWFTGYAHLQTVLVQRYAYIEEIGLPIALSGDTGLGGAHLHFEVRSPQHPTPTNWIDPWEANLWVGVSTRPTAALTAAPPPTLMQCMTIDGNNIRSGPGTDYELVTKSAATVFYEVVQVQRIQTGGTPGDWYHVRWSGTDTSGWIWSDLMTDCTSVEND